MFYNVTVDHDAQKVHAQLLLVDVRSALLQAQAKHNTKNQQMKTRV